MWAEACDNGKAKIKGEMSKRAAVVAMGCMWVNGVGDKAVHVFIYFVL